MNDEVKKEIEQKAHEKYDGAFFPVSKTEAYTAGATEFYNRGVEDCIDIAAQLEDTRYCETLRNNPKMNEIVLEYSKDPVAYMAKAQKEILSTVIHKFKRLKESANETPTN